MPICLGGVVPMLLLVVVYRACVVLVSNRLSMPGTLGSSWKFNVRIQIGELHHD